MISFALALLFSVASQLSAAIDKNKFSGVVLLAENGKPVFVQAFGFSDDINNVKSDVSSNAIFVMCPPWEETIDGQSLTMPAFVRI